jgi:hypothetical protein
MMVSNRQAAVAGGARMKEPITYQDVVESLAPCGIDCERCVRYESGTVRRLATELGAALEGFAAMAARSVDRVPVLSEYGRFVEILDFFRNSDCPGCRRQGCPLPFCAARDCYREKSVDFCFQCDEYPCERNQYPPMMVDRWLAVNDRMRDVGPVHYYQESLAKPRY